MSKLSYDVFVSDSPQKNGLLPNGEPKQYSPVASTLIYGGENAVLTDPAFTPVQTRALGDWVASKGRKLTEIFITHGHGDHWFGAGLLAERFGARVVATAGTIARMRAAVAVRSVLWDKLFPEIPPSPVTAVTVPNNRISLEGRDLVMVEVGHTDSPDTSVLHIPDLKLVVAGDVIYNGAHMYLAENNCAEGFGLWRKAIDKVHSLKAGHIVASHQNREFDDDAERTIAETRRYLDDTDELLETEKNALDFFNAKIQRFPSYVGRTVLWAGAKAIYGVRERPGENARQIFAAAWFE